MKGAGSYPGLEIIVKLASVLKVATEASTQEGQAVSAGRYSPRPKQYLSGGGARSMARAVRDYRRAGVPADHPAWACAPRSTLGRFHRLCCEAARAIGLDPTQYSGHSLRASFVTSAATASAPIWRIKAQTGHASDALVGRYIRLSDPFDGAGRQKAHAIHQTLWKFPIVARPAGPGQNGF